MNFASETMSIRTLEEGLGGGGGVGELDGETLFPTETPPVSFPPSPLFLYLILLPSPKNIFENNHTILLFN
jgi:hypothetical protein